MGGNFCSSFFSLEIWQTWFDKLVRIIFAWTSNILHTLNIFRTSSVAQMVKSLPVMWKAWVQSLCQKIPWRSKWQPTPVFLPGKSHGWRSLTGYSPWGRKESDTTEWLYFLSFNIYTYRLLLWHLFPKNCYNIEMNCLMVHVIWCDIFLTKFYQCGVCIYRVSHHSWDYMWPRTQ